MTVGLRTIASSIALTIAGTLIAACGSNTPAPIQQLPPIVVPSPPTATVNQPPVIDSIAISTDRAEVDTDVTVTATVRDAETPIDQLAFEWKADVGTVTGTGAVVKWRAPKGAPTPRDYTLTLTVTETYGSPDASGVRPKNTTTATSVAVRLHDSSKELADLSMSFLRDFANSSVSPSTCLRDFTDSCPGKKFERDDIENNRNKFQILGSTLNFKEAFVARDQLTANMRATCSFTSRRIKCGPDDSVGCTVGAIENADGDCLLTARYEQKRWWLCDSNFSPNGTLTPSMRAFFGIR
jgi:hypothetical protein